MLSGALARILSHLQRRNNCLGFGGSGNEVACNLLLQFGLQLVNNIIVLEITLI